MTTFNVTANACIFGIIEAATEKEARDIAAKMAGYKNEADMESQIEKPSEIVAASGQQGLELTDRIAFSFDRAECSYGQPVLVIDCQAFGQADVYGPAIRAALDNTDDPMNWLKDNYSGFQLLLDLCKSFESREALRAFCPTSWTSPNGEANS